MSLLSTIQNIEDQIQIGRMRVLIHNTWLQSPHVFQSLQKTVCLIVPTTFTPEFIQQPFTIRCPDTVVNWRYLISMSWTKPTNRPSTLNFLLMTTPLWLGPHPSISNQIILDTHMDILRRLRLMVFYNETFGFVPQDDLSGRKRKFGIFLTQFWSLLFLHVYLLLYTRSNISCHNKLGVLEHGSISCLENRDSRSLFNARGHFLCLPCSHDLPSFRYWISLLITLRPSTYLETYTV